ncbi:MAG: recombination mediator RecR [Oscillospiraceae bacterium]|nr:recombination mediator RecR [Oscillospiraceae bacterium]MDD4368927.1 recombination mediator RecR [Oscillospiraceae bacterium]
MPAFPPAIHKLVSQLASLPGIGQKSAQRLAFYILSQPADYARQLAAAISLARQDVALCSECFNLTETDPCEICQDKNRNHHTICVVESPADVAAMERTREYDGLYHVLHGAINPMQNIGPENLRLRELLTRLTRHPEVDEVILATNATVEGEATAMYLARLIKPSGIKTTRIAHGIPMGTNLEYADEVTLGRALAGRQQL